MENNRFNNAKKAIKIAGIDAILEKWQEINCTNSYYYDYSKQEYVIKSEYGITLHYSNASNDITKAQLKIAEMLISDIIDYYGNIPMYYSYDAMRICDDDDIFTDGASENKTFIKLW